MACAVCHPESPKACDAKKHEEKKKKERAASEREHFGDAIGEGGGEEIKGRGACRLVGQWRRDGAGEARPICRGGDGFDWLVPCIRKDKVGRPNVALGYPAPHWSMRCTRGRPSHDGRLGRNPMRRSHYAAQDIC